MKYTTVVEKQLVTGQGSQGCTAARWAVKVAFNIGNV